MTLRNFCLSAWLLGSLVIHGASIELTWDTSPGADGYKLFQSIGTAAFTSATNAGPPITLPLNTNAVTRWYVTAFNAGGDSPPSNTLTNTPATQPPPLPAMTNLAFQAEAGALVAPMTIGVDSAASDGKFIATTTAETGTALYLFSSQ